MPKEGLGASWKGMGEEVKREDLGVLEVENHTSRIG